MAKRFSLPVAMCSMPAIDGGASFEFDGQVLIYPDPATNRLILSLDLNLTTPQMDVMREGGGYFGFCELFLTPP